MGIPSPTMSSETVYAIFVNLMCKPYGNCLISILCRSILPNSPCGVNLLVQGTCRCFGFATCPNGCGSGADSQKEVVQRSRFATAPGGDMGRRRILTRQRNGEWGCLFIKPVQLRRWAQERSGWKRRVELP